MLVKSLSRFQTRIQNSRTMLREVAILLSVVTLVKCNQSCWRCSYERDVENCRQGTMPCPANEECFLEKVINNVQVVLYNAGCRSRTACKIMEVASGAIGKRSTAQCAQCCTGPRCQEHLCGLTPSEIPLTCLSCNSISSAGVCRNYRQCKHTEVCYASVNADNSLLSYSFGCQDKHVCQILAANHALGNPRGRIATSIPLCNACCVGDRCNHASCFILEKNMTMSMFST